MPPPPFIPPLDEDTFDKDVVAGLEGLHRTTSEELFDSTSPKSKSEEEVGTQPNTKGATYPVNRKVAADRHQHENRSLPAVLGDPTGRGVGGSGLSPRTASRAQWLPFVRSPEAISPTPQQASGRPLHSLPSLSEASTATTIYSTPVPPRPPTYPSSSTSLGTAAVPIPTTASSQFRTAETNPPITKSPPPVRRTTLVPESRSNQQQQDKPHQRYAFGTNWITASDPFVVAPGRAIGSGTSGRRNLFSTKTPRHLMPSKSPDDSDDTRIAEIPATSSQSTISLPNPNPPSTFAPPASIYGMTGVISGGVNVGPPSSSEFVASPPHPAPRRQQHGYSRTAASAPAGQSGSFPPPHPPQTMASVYGPEYNSTRATPSPGYMNSAYGVPQYSTVHPQVGQQYPPPRYPYAGTLPPPGMPHYPSFSQAAYGHLGVGGEMYPSPMYGQQSYVPSPEMGPVSGPRHSPTTAIGTSDGMATIPGAYPYPPTAIPGNGGPSSNSPPGALGQSGPSIAPASFQPHRVSPHGHPQSSPVSHPHSPHTAPYPQQYSTPPGNTPYAQYPFTYPVSPPQAQGFVPYPSPPMAPEDPSQQLSPTVGQYPVPVPQPGGTWWYVPPGGGPPRAFPTGVPAGYEYQGPFTMSFNNQPQRAQPTHQPQPPQPPQPPPTAAPDSPEQPTQPTAAPRGNPGRGAPAPRRPGQPRRGTAGRGVRGAPSGQRGRGASQFPQPRGGGPSGAGLAAGSPSGGSASHSQPTTSSDPPQPVAGASSRQTFVTGLAVMRKGKEPVRQAFHPRPQAHGHEWVMWVGNIPDHAAQNEVWNFFRNPQAVAYYMTMKNKNPNAPPAWPVLGSQESQSGQVDGSGEVGALDGPADGGVASVFVIKSSNCAFVNFETEDALKRAMRIFNGVPLRPYDPECPPLVCRIRRKDDDLRTGVAAQRGWGLHTNWIRLQAEAMKKAGLVPDGTGDSKKKWKGKERETVEVDGVDGADGSSEKAEAGSADLELQTDAGSSPQIIVPPHLRSHEDPPTSPSTHLGPSSNSDPSPPVKLEYARGGAGRGRPMPGPHQSSSASSGSYASTNSSFLARYFPKRYFILKSLSEYDLNLSVERGIWATQPHNEPILDQAFRTSKEVWLIFGANKSGEFFGYARMMSGISRGERKVPWGIRSESNSVSPGSVESPGLNRQRSSYSVIVEESAETSGHRDLPDGPPSPLAGKNVQVFGTLAPLASSPSPLTPGEAPGMSSPFVHLPRRGNPAPPINTDRTNVADPRVQSAPAELGPPYKRVTKPDTSPQPDTLNMPPSHPPSHESTGPTPHSGEAARPRLDPNAPLRAAKHPHLLEVDKVVTEEDIRRRAEIEGSSLSKAIESERAGGSNLPSEQWGTPFKITWVKMDRLPFVRVKHLRNPWNYDREVKISRDGIELEPSVGEALLQEWDKMEAEREAFQKVLQAQWVQREGQWYQADGRPAPSSGEPSSATDNTRASTARGADSRSP